MPRQYKFVIIFIFIILFRVVQLESYHLELSSSGLGRILFALLPLRCLTSEIFVGLTDAVLFLTQLQTDLGPMNNYG